MSEKRQTAIGNPLSEPGERRKIVCVTWRDSCHVDNYETADEAWPYIILRSVGFVLRDDADGIVLAMQQADVKHEDRAKHVTSIVRENIIGVEELSAVGGAAALPLSQPDSHRHPPSQACLLEPLRTDPEVRACVHCGMTFPDPLGLSTHVDMHHG